MPAPGAAARVGRVDPRRAALALAPLLVLASTVVQFVRTHEYPVLSPEVLVIGLGTLVAGVGCGLAAAAWPALLGPLVVALLVTLFADIHLRQASEPLVFLPALGASFLLGRNLGVVASVVFGTLLVSALVVPGQAPAGSAPRAAAARAADPGLPLVVHLIFDEHIGLAEFPTDDAEARAAKHALAAFLEDAGFRVFPAAFSEYNLTQHALSHLFNFATTFENGLSRRSRSGRFEYVLLRNDYFAGARRRGHRVRVYQPDFMDLCPEGSVEPGECRTYRASLAGALARTPLPTRAKAYVLASMLGESSTMYRAVRRDYEAARRRLPRLPLPGWSWERGRVHPIASLEAWADLRRDLASAAPGDMYVAHFLVPHFPFMYGPDCTLAPDPVDWLYRWPRDVHPPRSNTPETRARHYRRYWAQVGCAMRQTAATLEVLRERGLLDGAVVVLHGDHGSRIALTEPRTTSAARLTDQDFTDAFSTLFAVRAPGIPAGSDPRPVPITALFRALVTSGFQGAPALHAAREPVVYLQIPGTRRVSPYPLRGFTREARGVGSLRVPGAPAGRGDRDPTP